MTRPARRPPPRSVSLLWDGRERPARGPRPGLTIDAVVDAAIAVADEAGLSSLTMQRVAAELDVTTMALYRYVPGKEELVALMIDRAIGPAPRPGDGTWRAELVRWAHANLAVLQRHPWLMSSIVGRVSIGPLWLTWVDAALAIVAPLGITARQRMAVVILVDGHVRAAAQLSASSTVTREWAAAFESVLERIAGDPRYASLGAVAAEGGFDPPSKGEPEAFAFGLERILDGIESFSGERRQRRRR